MKTIKLEVNGTWQQMEVESDWSLMYVIREVLGLTGTKCGCGDGSCGACTAVHLVQPFSFCMDDQRKRPILLCQKSRFSDRRRRNQKWWTGICTADDCKFLQHTGNYCVQRRFWHLCRSSSLESRRWFRPDER